MSKETPKKPMTIEDHIIQQIKKEGEIAEVYQEQCKTIIDRIVTVFLGENAFPIQSNYKDIDISEISESENPNKSVVIQEYYSKVAQELGASILVRKFNLMVEKITNENTQQNLTYDAIYLLAIEKTFPENISQNISTALENFLEDLRSTDEAIIALLDPKQLKTQYEGFVLEAGAKIFEQKFLEEFAKTKIEK